MADTPEDDELLLDNELKQDDEPLENDADNQDDDSGPDEDGDEEETVISLGGDAPTVDQENDSGLIKKLRAEIRERDKRLAEVARPAPAKIEVGEKPTMESCEYDEEKFEASLTEWHENKRKADEQEANAQKAAEEADQRAQKVMQVYTGKRDTIPDIDVAEEEVRAELGDEFMKGLVYASEDPALIKALQLYPDKRKALADLRNDPLKAIFEAGKLAAGLTVTKRRKAPAPEQVERGGGAPSGSTDRQIEKLEKEAERTGDRTKLIEYKRKLRAKS